MFTPEAPLRPEEQDERYMRFVPEIQAAFQAGYDPDRLFYHVWEHGLAVRDNTKGYREELRSQGVEGIAGDFMTEIDGPGHDYLYEKYWRLKMAGDKTYSSAEELTVVEGGQLLRSFGIDQFTINEWATNVWGTKLGVRCDSWGPFTLCAGDMSNTGEDFETVVKTDTENLRLEKEGLEGIDVDPIKFSASSILVVSGYHFTNLNVPRLLAKAPAIRQMHERQGANLRTWAFDTAAMVGEVGEDAANRLVQSLGGAAARLRPVIRKKAR